MTIWKSALFVLLTVALGAQADTHWQEGKHYERLGTPVNTFSDDKIEVAEVFWYGCPHCYSLKPVIEAWEEDLAEDINFVLLPAALGRNWEPHAYAFYASEALGAYDKTHDALFEALAGERRQLDSAEKLADYLAEHDVDRDAFIKAYNSFGVNAKVQQAQAIIRGARVTGVPTLLVNGKYKTSSSMAGGHEAMLDVVDYLVEKEREATAE